MAIVTLLTDFGTVDGYVGAMKGVILAGAPDAVVVDLTHDVPRHDVPAGAFALAQASSFFPAGTIHVAVVDPGVGGARQAVVVDDGRHLFVAPDNGLLAFAVPNPVAARAIAPELWRASVCPTFHGRDVFAQAAAMLASGSPFAGAGPETHLEGKLSFEPLAWRADGSEIVGHVIHVDRFGNLVSDIPAANLPPDAVTEVRMGSLVVGSVAKTYADVGRGSLVAYRGSSGTLEIAVREGSAAAEHRIGIGAEIVVSLGVVPDRMPGVERRACCYP
ncbi:MAG: SAM-dependent chlorinase/fluorinase [Pseudomonadota bacterium]